MMYERRFYKLKGGVLVQFDSATDIDAKFLPRSLVWKAVSLSAGIVRPFMMRPCRRRSTKIEKFGIHVTAFWCGWEGRRVWDFYEGQLTLGLAITDRANENADGRL